MKFCQISDSKLAPHIILGLHKFFVNVEHYISGYQLIPSQDWMSHVIPSQDWMSHVIPSQDWMSHVSSKPKLV